MGWIFFLFPHEGDLLGLLNGLFQFVFATADAEIDIRQLIFDGVKVFHILFERLLQVNDRFLNGNLRLDL